MGSIEIKVGNTWIITPMILWIHMTKMPSGHSSVVYRAPYPMVCCVSMLNRKHEAKPYTLATHGFQPDSPCLSADKDDETN